MTKHLQLSIDGDEFGQHVHFTPIDIPISDDAALKGQEFIALLDMTDLTPGDSTAETAVTIKLPVHISFINFDLKLQGVASLKIVDHS